MRGRPAVAIVTAMATRRLYVLWTAGTAAAEMAGYACAAVLFPLWGGPVLGGFAEGTVLGVVQAAVLRRHVPGFPAVAWWAATVTVATLGWGSASAFQGGGGGGAGEEHSTALVLAGAAGLGAGMGLVMGTAQWLVLRRRLAPAWTWIPASILGWGIGMVPAFWVALLPEAGASVGERLGLGALGGLLMGLAVGAVTGSALSHMSSRQTTRRMSTAS